MQCVTTDPSDLIESDKEEGHQRTNTKQGNKDTYQNPPSLPSTFKESKQQPCNIIHSRAKQHIGHEYDGNSKENHP
jgi:hypothetical protein